MVDMMASDSSSMATPVNLLLDGLRVTDLTVERGELCARLFGDLGAEVVKVEPPGGSPARRLPPVHNGVGLFWAFRNVGKRSVELDLPAEADRLDQLLAHSDVVVVSAGAGEAVVDPQELADRHRHLVVTAISPYGLTGPWTDRSATEGVLAATATMAWKVGVPEREPLLPPGSFVDDSTSVTFAFATLCALWQREGHGAGQLLDCAQNDAMAGMADWALPNSAARQMAGEQVRDVRSGTGPVWPSLRCADGFVRIVILSPRQWRAVRAWLGEPDFLQDPELDTLPGRLAISDAVINPLIEALFADKTMAEIATEAQQRGIVCTPLATPADVLHTEHFLARRSLVDLPLGDDVSGPVPSGYLEVDGLRAGPRTRPPTPGEHTAEVFADLGDPRHQPGSTPPPGRPLAGLRVADFGQGGVGVEVGRMFAEYGADVIKIESRSYPDFIRVATGTEMSPSFASSSRSKRAFGVNLKAPEGYTLLRRLIGHCDLVIENNATGVMAANGLGFADLSADDPGIVMLSSQLMGSSGPWAAFRGYGPSTRAAGGIEMLWNYEDSETPAGGTTIFPDHLAGRVGALGALAALFAHRRGRGGAHVEVAQVEVTIGMVGEYLTKEALEPGSVRASGNRRGRGAPWGLFRCAGDEQWVAITCRNDEDWKALVGVMGSPEWATADAFRSSANRASRASEVEEGVTRWTVERAREDIVTACQAAGVPAGEMLTPLETIDNEHYAAHQLAVEVVQPGLDSGRLILDGAAFTGSLIGPPTIGPAPAVGQHTRKICTDLLGMAGEEIEPLISSGVLEVTPGAEEA